MNSDYPKIALQGITGLLFVDSNEILYAEVDGNYTNVQLTEGRDSKVLRQLQELESLLPAENFSRIHRAHIINLKHVIRLEENEKVIMSDGKELDLAGDRKMEFIENFTRI